MSQQLFPGERVPLPKHELLRVVLGWDAPPTFPITTSCVSMTPEGKVVDVVTGSVLATKDRVVIVDDKDYTLDLTTDTGLNYIFNVHSAERMETVKTLSLAIVNSNGDIVLRYDQPATFGYKSCVLATIRFRKEWKIRAVGIGGHADSAIALIPYLKAIL